MNLFTLLDGAARAFADLPAVCSGLRTFCTYAGLHRAALDIGHDLARRFEPGTRVAILAQNCPEYVETLFGIWAAGLVAVPINCKLHSREVEQILKDSAAALLVGETSLVASVRLSMGECTGLSFERIGTLGSGQHAPRLVPAEVEDNALAWLFYTSGTTGRSKGAMLTHANLRAMAVSHLADVEALDESCSQIHAAPMSHGSGLYILPSIARGARLVIPESRGFDPEEFLALCEIHPCCTAFFAPTMVQRLRMAVERGTRAPSGLRTVIYGGGPMYVEDLRRSMAVFGPIFVQIYGQGESPMTITWLRREDHHDESDDRMLGSVGRARTGMEVRVVDEDGTKLPCGEVGEIVCRGPAVMAGYWNDPAATTAALRGGWLWTGDMGSMDEHGLFTLKDRSKDLIISGGSNIYPREVEEVLLRHHGVSEVCVIGRPHPEWGEEVVAFVVPAEGEQVDIEMLDRLCLSSIARFKRPKEYFFVLDLPKNSYGKVLRRALRDAIHSRLIESSSTVPNPATLFRR